MDSTHVLGHYLCLESQHHVDRSCDLKKKRSQETRPIEYKTFFMLNSTQHEIYNAHKCKNANNCCHDKNTSLNAKKDLFFWQPFSFVMSY